MKKAEVKMEFPGNLLGHLTSFNEEKGIQGRVFKNHICPHSSDVSLGSDRPNDVGSASYETAVRFRHCCRGVLKANKSFENQNTNSKFFSRGLLNLKDSFNMSKIATYVFELE